MSTPSPSLNVSLGGELLGWLQDLERLYLAICLIGLDFLSKNLGGSATQDVGEATEQSPPKKKG
jgi:hypothetical protein